MNVRTSEVVIPQLLGNMRELPQMALWLKSSFADRAAAAPAPATGKGRFLEKAAQKLLLKLGRAGFAVTGPAKQKFFAPLFFKKAATFLFSLKPIML
jgi:hypothetical protein